MRICLITPSHLSTNPRTVKEADALAAAGHEVTVVSATYQAWSKEADEVFASRPWKQTPPVPYGPDAPRVRRLVQVVRNKSSKALFAAGSRSPSVIAAACHPATPDLAHAAARCPANIYVAHNLGALPAAAWAARLNGARYAFDAEDFHVGQFPDGDNGFERVLTEVVERRWLARCAWITAASPGIADSYADAYGVARPTVLLNVFPLIDAPVTLERRASDQPQPSLYWFSQTIGPNRGLETAVRALSHSRSRPSLYLRGQPSRGFDSRLMQLASAEGVAHRLHFQPTSTPTKMATLAAHYDLGLSGEPGHNLNNRIALGNKLFTYLLARVPVIASDVDAHRRIAPEFGDAMTLYRREVPSSLANAFDSLLCDRTRLERAKAAASHLARERFNWDLEQAKLIELVDRVTHTRDRT